MGRIALYFRDNSTFGRNISSTCSESKGKSSKKLSETGLACCLLLMIYCLVHASTLKVEAICLAETSDCPNYRPLEPRTSCFCLSQIRGPTVTVTGSNPERDYPHIVGLYLDLPPSPQSDNSAVAIPAILHIHLSRVNSSQYLPSSA